MPTKAHDTIKQAQEIVGSGMEFDRLDQIFDLQRLIGPVIAYKKLLEVVINSADTKEQRLAATTLIQSAQEDPERIAERLRASIFHELSLEQLQAIVQTGITDPEEAMQKIQGAA